VISPQHGHRRRVVGVERLERGEERGGSRSVDRVPGLRTIHDHRRHGSVLLDPNTTTAHGFSRSAHPCDVIRSDRMVVPVALGAAR